MHFKLSQIHCLAFLLCIINAGCAKKTVAHTPVSGAWLLTLSTRDVGEVKTIMNFDIEEKNDSGQYPFTAYTEKNVDKKIIGFWKSEMARLFTSNFKHGSLIRIDKGKIIQNDSLTGVLVSPFGNYYITARITGDQLTGALKNSKHEIIGTVNSTHNIPSLPLRNYKAIMNNIVTVTQDKIYDPSILKQQQWLTFTEQMSRVSNMANDDATFIMAFFYYAKNLPFTHFNFYHPAANSSDSTSSSPKFVQLIEKTPETMYMKIESFSGTATEMDSAFQYIDRKRYKNLIVDIRDNSGGSIAAGMAFARHLFTDTIYGGIFLTQKYFKDHTQAPPVSDYNKFLSFTEANYDLIIKGVNEQKGICLKMIPYPPIYTGKLYLLINGRTASTCEPLAYVLKQHKRAILIGSKTAGAMLNGEQFDIQDGFKLVVPTATYYTSDGYKIDKQGVAPDTDSGKEDALQLATKELNIK